MTIELTVRQVEILASLQDAKVSSVTVAPGGNTDVANLHVHGPDGEHLHTTGTTYARVLYPLRDAGLITISEVRSPLGRRVEITELGRVHLAAHADRSVTGVEARIKLAPRPETVIRLLTLGYDDARRMARALREIEDELDFAERRGETVQISRIRRHVQQVSRG